VTLLVFAGSLTLADLVYMHFFGSIVPVSSLGHANHLGEVFGSARTRLVPEQLWLFFPPLCGAVLWYLGFRLAPEREGREEVEAAPPRLAWRHRLLPLGLCILLGWTAARRLGKAMAGGLGAKVFSEQHNAQRFGIFNAHAFDLARAVREMMGRRVLDDDARERVEAFFADASEFAAVRRHEGDDAFGAAQGANLLLIQVEALQSWVIGTRIEGREVTPYLNRLREEALSFPRIVDQTAQGKTSDGEYLVLNSQHPLPRGATAFLRADNHFWTVAHALAEAGYATSSAHPYRRGFWNRAVLHPRYGFESSVFRRELGPGQYVGWGLADGLFFERMLPRLRAAAQPWFAFWVTLSLHHPYDEFPDALATLEVGELEGKALGNYLQAMNYFDRSLEELVEKLEQEGLLDHTVVALYGDHDARFELDEHPELLELAGAGVWTPSTFAVMESVPFFVLLPEGDLHGEVEVTGGQIDVGPTLLHLLGVDRPGSFVGHPLLPGLSRNFSAYPNGGAYAPDRVWVRRGRDIPRGGACFFFPSGKPRPREDCKEIADRSKEELGLSRAVADTDMQRSLADVDVRER
jgi:phosphoglycerol transferase MdoB-like AlkP superfamily enzyme